MRTAIRDLSLAPGCVRSAANLVVIAVDPSRIVIGIAERKASLAAWAKRVSKP